MNEQEAFALEIDMIASIGRHDKKLGPLCNLTDGGDGMSGFLISKETRKKLSDVKMGEKNHFFGKYHTQETKEKIGEKNKKMSGINHPNFGKHFTKETREKQSISHKGKVLSVETKQKMKEAQIKRWLKRKSTIS